MEHRPADGEVSSRAWETYATNQLVSACEQLRLGHGLLTRQQFVHALSIGDFEVWQLPAGAYALIGWGSCAEGETCNILTVTGDYAAAAERGIVAIEQMARKRGARMVICVARAGWKSLFKKHGYNVEPKVLVKKVFES